MLRPPSFHRAIRCTSTCVSGRRGPARPGRWRLPHQPITPDGAGPDDILASDSPPRASGSPGSPPPSTAAPPRGSPCCSSGPSWPGAGGPSPPGSGRPSSATSIQSCYIAVAAAGKRADRIAATPPDRGGQAAARAGPTRLTLALDDTPTQAVRAARPGGRRPPQPDPRPGRLALRLRPRLRRPRAARHPPGVGRDRPAAAGPALRPQEGPAGHRPEAPAGVPHQAGAGRRAAAVGQALAGAAGQADLGGGRRGLCQEGVPQAGDGPGDDGRQPAPQGRGPADAARAAAAGAAGPGPGPTATDVIDLAKRAGQRRGWSTETFDAVRGAGGQAVQDVPGDLAAGRRRDPGGAGGRADRLAGVLLHRPLGERRRHPDGPWPTASAWRSPSASASRSSGRASSRCGSSGRTSGRSTSACGRSR